MAARLPFPFVPLFLPLLGLLPIAASSSTSRPSQAARQQEPERAAGVAPSRYENGAYGFSLTPPAFPRLPAGGGGPLAQFFAAPADGFASNMNVTVQERATTRDEYLATTKRELQDLEWKIEATELLEVDGEPAILLEYTNGTPRSPMEKRSEGMQPRRAQAPQLHFVALAVVTKERVFLVTGTTPAAQWERDRDVLRASVQSFRLNAAGK